MKNLISKNHAIDLIKKVKLKSNKLEKVKILNSLGRKSAKKIYSPINLPQLPTAGLDGYVISNLKSQEIKIHQKHILCGIKSKKLDKKYAYKINTGASTDLIFKYLIPLEKAKIKNGLLSFNTNDAKKSDIKKIGEDLKKNTLILDSDEIITEFKIALLASVGIEHIYVMKKISVGVFSIGDELIDLGKTSNNKNKIYDSNRYQILNFIKQWPLDIIDLGILKDNEKLIFNFYNKNISKFDLLISSGGSSSSDKDFISKFLDNNSKIIFKYIKIKPGRPCIFSTLKNKFIFALPGNPLAVSINLIFIVSEFLNLFSTGKKILSQEVISSFGIKKSKAFNNYYRVKINNKNVVRLYNPKGSAKLISLSNADGLVEIPEGTSYAKIGDKLKLFKL